MLFRSPAAGGAIVLVLAEVAGIVHRLGAGCERRGQECRRKALLHILEHENQLCTGCDVCDGKRRVPEGLKEILELVKRNSRHITAQKVSTILKGNLSPENIQKRVYRSKSWGKLQGWEEKEIAEAILMITQGNFMKNTYNKKLCINREKWVELQDIM